MKKKIIAIAICTILFIYFLGGIFYSFIKKGNKESDSEKQIVSAIKGYNYVSYEDDIKVYKNEFENLKKNLESEKIDYKEYAISISKLFLIDLYTLDSKKNKYDIGGTEFVYQDIVDNYKLKVENTLYKYIIDNSDNDRKQELPVVKNVELNSIEEIEYDLKDTNYEAYKVNLNIEYEKDLEYDKEADVIIIKNENYLYIVEKN